MASGIDTRAHSYTPTSKEDARATFCALGENWWKQLIDGKFHQHGPKVFDEGLHSSGIAEPGFYESAFTAYQFIQEHLCEPMSVQLYQEIHKIACSHFRGEENSTLCTTKETGAFRNSSSPPIRYLFYTEKFLRTITGKEFSKRTINNFLLVFNHCSGTTAEEKIKSYGNVITVEDYEKLKNIYVENVRILRKKSFKFNCSLQRTGFVYYYDNLLARDVERLFEKFNRKICEAYASIGDHQELKERKIELIARLYQQLEWAHPFVDGQGRTDLLLLAKLLSEHGLTPAILEDPYISSCTFTSHWVDYLKKGMLLWEQEQSMIQSGELKHG